MQFPENHTTRSLAVLLPLVLLGSVLALGLLAQPPEDQPPEDREARITQLIEQLGDDGYFVRQRAQEALAEFSFEAFDLLSAATTHEDLEIAARARYLLGLLRVQWSAEDTPAEAKKLLADYDRQDTPEKLARIRALAALSGGKGVDALCRLVRFEQSGILSKHAALALLQLQPEGQPPEKALAEKLKKNLAGSRRSATRWLLTWSQLADDPQAALKQWGKWIDAEEALLRGDQRERSTQKTSARIVAGLVRFQIPWLKKLDRHDETAAAMRRLIDLEPGDPGTLAELLDWLVKQKAWKSVDQLAEKFDEQFAGDPMLLYSLAEALLDQQRKEEADRTAAQALKLHGGKDRSQLFTHLRAAYLLEMRGLHRWSEQEHRHVIEQGTPGDEFTHAAQFRLSEMLHDQGEDTQAAEVLQQLLDKLPKETPAKKQIGSPVLGLFRSVREIRARMSFFRACDLQTRGQDPDKQRDYLDKALEADSADVDVLIACYRTADRSDDYREKIRRLIRKASEKLRRQMADDPDNPTSYNQFAWLVGNTEGDFDEAIRFSKKSIELGQQLAHNVGGYYDTLAHIYFAKADYENAVKTQLKAVELEPHSGLVARQLKVFQKKWEEQKAKPKEQE